MKIIETTVYEFAELNDKAKVKARDWYREGSLDYDWWESTYWDAERIGLKLTGFALDRNRHADGHFIEDAVDVAEMIMKEHGKDCETFKTAKAYLSNIGKDEDERVAYAAEFEKSILEDYSIMLQDEYEWLLSDEQVDESIITNGYTFTEMGKREG